MGYILLAIHRAAGPQLEFAIADIPEVQSGVRCPTGEAIITPYAVLDIFVTSTWTPIPSLHIAFYWLRITKIAC